MSKVQHQKMLMLVLSSMDCVSVLQDEKHMEEDEKHSDVDSSNEANQSCNLRITLKYKSVLHTSSQFEDALTSVNIIEENTVIQNEEHIDCGSDENFDSTPKKRRFHELDENYNSSSKKRRFCEPRFISEVTLSDFSTPRRAGRTLKFIKEKDQERKKKMKRLHDVNKRYKKRIVSLKEMVKHLNTKGLVSHDAGDALTSMMSQATNNKLVKLLKKRIGKYSEEIRSFALTLHFYSPKAYNYIRKTWGKQFLPHSSTIRKWYQVINGSPGFTKEALIAIITRASQKKGHSKSCYRRNVY
ncbi:uncharacterized protein [Anoplolepis gracilipes]|uniref:uncharacterized protein isoform X2 n=1 Tax=Anoplolepis gracilipes TaxID=354296 RepID=UPI003BA0746D